MSESDWFGKSEKLSVLRLLSILKHFYTFKELEDLLGIPYQRLWRYITLTAMPEKSTMEKLLSNIKDKKLIEEILSQMVSGEQFETWWAIRNVGFVELICFIAVNMLRKEGIRVNTVVSFPDEYSATFATILAEYTGSCLCITSRNSHLKDAIVETYYSGLTGNIELLVVPRGCIKKKSNVLLVTFDLNDLNTTRTSIKLVERAMANPKKVFSVIARKDTLEEMNRRERLCLTLKTID